LENSKPRKPANVSGRGPAIEYSDEFEQIWKIYPKRVGGNVKSEAYQAFKARIRNGATSLAMKAGVERYRAYCDATGSTGTQFVKQTSVFLGPQRHWEQDWELPEVKAKGPKTDDEWLAFGKSLGKAPRPGESWHEFKQRLQP
jgi:hypothetical protein